MVRRNANTITVDSVVDQFHGLKADFRAGEDSRFQSRLKGVDPNGSGADYHIRSERKHLHMIERSRHYRRDDVVVGQGVERVVANVIQDGFTLEPQTTDPGFNTEVKEAWKEWADDEDLCDDEGERTFHDYERMVLDAVITDGATLVLPLHEGTLQAIEVHRLRTPKNTKQKVVHGILLDDRKRRQAYWVVPDDIGINQSVQRVGDVNQIAARDDSGNKQAFYIYDPKRFSATIGTTALAPISYIVGAHDDLQFAALLKQQMGALIAILRERGPNWKPVVAASELGPSRQEDVGGYTRTIQGMSAGLEVASDPDEKLSMFSAQVPGPQFKEHSLLVLTFIAINLNLPLAVLLLDPSMTNFSGWRGAIEQARIRWRQMQRMMIHKFHCPVYHWWLRRQLVVNKDFRGWDTKLGKKFWRHLWNPPQWPYLEPLTDASADLLQDRNALNSKRRIQAARGRQWTEVLGEIIEDNSMGIVAALKKANEINEQFPGANITWRDVLTLATPDGVNLGITAGAGGEPATANAKPASGKEAA